MLPPGIAYLGMSSEILEQILEPDVQLAIWRRPLPPLLDGIEALDWQAIDDIDETIEGPNYAGAIVTLLADAGYPQGGLTGILALEIDALATRFAPLMGCPALRFRLEVVATDGCRKFHMDYVTARLLMPLVGPGTQWIEVAAGADAPVHQLRPGDVGVFKGRVWAPQPAILHRSPPIASSGISRLLLALDPYDDVERHRLAVEKARGA